MTKIIKNATWKYLLPCLKGHGNNFAKLFTELKPIFVGLGDKEKGEDVNQKYTIFSVIEKGENINILTNSLNWIKDQDYYLDDYEIDKKHHMIVIYIPSEFYFSYDKFIEGEYSEMYSKEQISFLFSHPSRIEHSKVLAKNREYKDIFIDKINLRFGTTVQEGEFDKIDEFDYPIEKKNEIFNY